jgi:purine-binding chemotaxis protein CheW
MTSMIDRQLEQGAPTELLATFFVRNSLCALDAAGVQEVIRVQSITPVRHAPDEVAGVMNLRGKIVTLLDLGKILGFPKTAITRDSRVFIIEDRNEFLGVLVDRVGEVIEVESGQKASPPVNIPPSQARFIQGICRHGGHVIALLNPHEILNEALFPSNRLG